MKNIIGLLAYIFGGIAVICFGLYIGITQDSPFVQYQTLIKIVLMVSTAIAVALYWKI